MADTKYNFPHQPPVSNTICVRLCLTGKSYLGLLKKEVRISIFYKQGIRIINLVYFSQIINLCLTQTPQTYAEFASRFALAAPDGTRKFTMRVLRKSAESA